MHHQRTYDRFFPHALMPAVGWRAVYFVDTGAHVAVTVHALALAVRVTYACHTRRVVPPEGDPWEIVGLGYSPGDGWVVADEVDNFCGLLPPGMTLAAFEQDSLCRYRHEAQQTATA